MFEPQQPGGLSKVELAYQALRDKPTGEVILYADLPYAGKVAQCDVNKIMEREQNRSIESAREVSEDGRAGKYIGWVIVSGNRQTARVARNRRRASRWAARALHTARHTDRRDMSGEDRRRADEELIKAAEYDAKMRSVAARRLGLDDIKAWNSAHGRD